MVSGLMIGGMVTAFLVCTVLVLGAFVMYFRKRENVQGTLFVLILGMIVVIFTQNIADVLAALMRLPALMEQSYLLAMIIYGVLIALIDILLRLYFVSFMSRSGIGKVRGTVFACGNVSGQCLMPMLTLFMYIVYSHMINQGIFLDGLEVGSDAYTQAAVFQNDLIQAPALMYYAVSFEYAAKAVLHSFITMALVRGVLEEKKGKSFAVLFGVRAAYEVIYQLIYALSTEGAGAAYEEKTALMISLVFSVLVIATGIYMWKPLIAGYPAGREPRIKQSSGKQAATDAAQRKKNLAWQEVRNMNRPADITSKVTTGAVKENANPEETTTTEVIQSEDSDAVKPEQTEEN